MSIKSFRRTSNAQNGISNIQINPTTCLAALTTYESRTYEYMHVVKPARAVLLFLLGLFWGKSGYVATYPGYCWIFSFLLCFALPSFAQEAKTVHSFDCDEKAYPVPRLIEYSYQLENKSSSLIKDVRFLTYAPVSRTTHQYCKNIETSLPSAITRDDLGNQILEFSIPRIAPFETVIIRLSADLRLSSEPRPAGNGDTPIFTQKSAFIESDDAEIVKLSKSLGSGSRDKSAEAFYRWICENIKDAGYTAADLGASEALKRKAGDCSEKAYLFCSLCRSAGIPAQYHSGYYVIKNAVLKPFQFHNWANYFDGKLWRMADPQMKKFQNEGENFISFTIGGGSGEKLMNGMHRFRIDNENIKVSMK